MTSRLISIVAVAALTANFVQAKLPTENLFFYETFDGEDPFTSGKWTKSSDIKYADQPVMVKTLSKPLEGNLPVINKIASDCGFISSLCQCSA